MTAPRWVAALAVRGNETGFTARIVALFALIQMSHGLGANAADALFLVRFGVRDLPIMIVLSGPAVMIATLLHGVGLAKRGPRSWLWVATLATALWAGLGWAGTWLGRPWVYAVIWISTQAIIWVTFTMLWNGAESACDTRQAKRLFPLFAAGGVFGGVVGNLLSGPIASWRGAQHLLLVQALLLLGGASLLYRIRYLFADDEVQNSSPFSAELRAAIGAVRSSRLLMHAAVTALLMSLLFFLVVFPFNEAVSAAFASEAEVAGYLGVFSSIAAAATFLVSLLLTKRLFSTLGIVVALLVVPLVYLGGFSLWLASFGLAAAALIRGAQWVTVNAIGSVAYAALFNVVTGRRRSQVMTFMTAVPAQIGTMIGGGVLIVGANLPRSARFGIGLVLSLGLLVMVLAMRPAYTTAIVSAVRQGLIGVFAVPQRGLVTPVDAEARRVLMTHLDDSHADTRAMALSALARVDGDASTRRIESFMSDESPLVRVAAFDSMCTVNPDRVLERAQTAITDEAWEVRLRVMQVVGSTDHGEYRPVALTALADPHPRVAAAAATIVGGESATKRIAELLATEEVEAISAVLEETAHSHGSLVVDATPYLAHPHRQVRAAAAAAYVFGGGDPSLLLPGLDDPSLRVRRATAQSLAKIPQGRELLNGVLISGTVNATDEALRAITPMSSLEPKIADWASKEAIRVQKLRSLGAALESPSPSPAMEFLAEVVAARASRFEQWVLMAITTTETEELMPILERGLRSSDSETRAQAVEALEMTGDRRALKIMLPLLEWNQAGPVPDVRSALRELLSDFDPWLRALATRCLEEEIASDLARLRNTSAHDQSPIVRSAVPSLAEVTTERFDMLNPMDRVMALHRVPMFSGLDPEDLELIASATAEVHFQPNELIYREGEEAVEMLVIVEGSAVISTYRGSTREVIRTHESGQHVGELGLLGGGYRSADVIAGEQGVHGVVVTKVDLLSILEERPAVALGMLTTLAKRLAEQA